MNKIKFNDVEFEVESYNKNTSFNGEEIDSYASCSIITNDVISLGNVAMEEITSLQIIHDEEVIYDLHDINAKIDNINEYLNGDRININVNLKFDTKIA